MKLSKAEILILTVTAVLLALMGGYYLGTGRTRPMEYAAVSAASDSPTAPEKTAASPEPADSLEPEPASPEPAGPVDINTAGLEELMTLPNIGEKRAQAILDYREEHGPFEHVEDLIRVSGIGEGILEGLMDFATAGGESNAENFSG